MIETVILDNTERLLAAAGEKSALSGSESLISARSQMTCLGRDSKAAFPYSLLAVLSGNSTAVYNTIWRSDAGNVLLIADSSASPFDTVAINLSTGAMTQDSTGRQFNYLAEDASGVIWANGINAGQYGLWKRTGAGAWTRLLSDTAAGKLQYWIDGTLYYISSTTNWYSLANGAATVSANPSSANTGWYQGSYPPLSNDIISLTQNLSKYLGLGNLPITPGYAGSAGEMDAARYWPVSARGQTSGAMVAPLSNVNWETLSELTQPNIVNATTEIQTNYSHQFIRLNSTYMLHVSAVSYTQLATSRLPNIGARKLVLTLLNKTTGINKYIGSVYLTASSTIAVSATNAAWIYGNVVGARLTSGVLDLWIAQGTYTTSVASDIYGLFKKSLTLNLDF